MTEEAGQAEPLTPEIRLDHLAKLADDRWREYDSKSQAEWKLSYAVWGTLLAAGGTLVTQKDAIIVPSLWLALIVFFFVVAALAIHLRFLCWIHQRLSILRRQMIDILRRRQQLLNLEPAEPPSDKNFRCFEKIRESSGRDSMYVQALITLLLGLLLIGVTLVVKMDP